MKWRLRVAIELVLRWSSMLKRENFKRLSMRPSMLLVFTLIFGISWPVTALAQANNGAGEGKPEVHVDFYKLPPGRQDEWLALYKKSHFR